MRKTFVVVFLVLALIVSFGCSSPAPTATPPKPAASAPTSVPAAATSKPVAPAPTVAPTAPTVQPLVLKYADLGPPDDSRGKAVVATLAEIEQKTQGRVKHQAYWTESLAKGTDILNAITTGLADVGHASSPAYHPGDFPVWQFPDLPFVSGDDQRAVAKALNELYDTNPDVKKDMDKPGQHLLTFVGLTSANLVAKRQLVDLADFKGMKIRALGGVAKWLSKIGAVPVSMTLTDVPDALSRGVIEGAMAYTYRVAGLKLYESAKFFTITGVSHPTVDYKINQNSWNKMTPADQKVYQDAWRNTYVDQYALNIEKDMERYMKDFQTNGLKVINLTPAQLAIWRESAAFTNGEYVAAMQKIGVDGAKIVSEYQRLYQKYEAKK